MSTPQVSPFSGMEAEEVAQKVEIITSKTIEKLEDTASTAATKVKQAAGATTGIIKIILTNPRAAIQPIIDFLTNAWQNNPFFRWFTYIVGTFAAIPTIVLLGWITLTCAIVVGIAGIGIICTEGFLAFLGGLVFFPVVGVLLFIASIGGLIGGFLYVGVKAVYYVLSGLGIIPREWDEKIEDHMNRTGRGRPGQRRGGAITPFSH
ncbi:hypothetical protein G9A89_010458 [Geosiphon pyriformis]|nr:hypothetical protein G9A89_010458 [Geosiphon pyriformis]